jgi:hypothetical protein
MVFAEQPVSSWLVCSRLDPMSPRPALDSLTRHAYAACERITQVGLKTNVSPPCL